MLLIWVSRFFCWTCKVSLLVLWESGFFFNLSAPAVTVILHSSHENESAEILGKNLLGYVFCCK